MIDLSQIMLAQSWIIHISILLLISLVLLFKYGTRKYEYWKKRGVVYLQPTPLLGNLSDLLFLRKNTADWIASLYAATDAPYLGFFAFDEPYLFLRCPKLIQRIMVKDFSYFMDRSLASPPHDEIMANFTFLQKSPGWKTSRTKLTPLLSSGKIKHMFSFINNIGEDLVQYLERNLGIIEAKEVAAKYSTNVIAKCSFGIDALCFEDEDADFRKFARHMFDFTWRNALANMMYFFRQRWVGIFRIDFINWKAKKFLCEAFAETMRRRKLSNMRAGDFVDLLNDLKESSESSESAIKKAFGHAIMFFSAGFETTSSTISFALHELCLNKTIQNRLRKEIVETIESHGGITYDAIQEMKYLKMCIDETLRKYPVIPFLDRICNADYKLPGTDLVIEKGTPVYIPMYGLHRDEKYFPNPQEYNPERFLKKNINENGSIYIAFGEGPRNCLGERFGLLSTQLALVHIISRFEVEKCDRTPDPVQFSPTSFVILSKVGLPMTVKLCETSSEN